MKSHQKVLLNDTPSDYQDIEVGKNKLPSISVLIQILISQIAAYKQNHNAMEL